MSDKEHTEVAAGFYIRVGLSGSEHVSLRNSSRLTNGGYPLRSDAKGWLPCQANSSNSILDRLPSTQREALIARMQMIQLPVGTVLTRPGELPEYAHFMTSGITSVVTYMKDGGAAEVGLIGKEGIVEAMHLLGSANSPTTAFVQVAGSALRIPFERFRRKLSHRVRCFAGFSNSSSGTTLRSLSSPPVTDCTKSRRDSPAGC